MNLRNQSAVVTGASRGLGRALAESLAARGSRVVLIARGEDDLHRVVDGIRSRGGEAHALAADVGDVETATAIAARASELVGPVDLLINNASSLGPLPLGVLLDTSPDDVARVFSVNLLGPFALTRVLAGSMLVRGAGTVVNVSSDAAVEAYATWGAYGASKAALDHMTRIWAAELEGTGVRFVSVDPGEMDTKMHEDAMPGSDRSKLASPRDVAQRILAMLAAQERLDEPRVLASAWSPRP